ncbi:MAG TPA: 30S ribosomal protein S2 [Candidatus Saccharimonadales bacterium]|nr:30S ribosomal protein S2 [Candidatus Saccharimonadales bacterium]
MPTVDVDIKKLLEAGAHFGHQTSRWHPKMAPYIHSKRGSLHIIDLTKTVEGLERALDFVATATGQGKQILFVGTKRQSKDIVLKLAEDTKMPFVVNRWLGGMLTNWPTISTQIKRLKDLEAKMETGELQAKYNKLEVQRFQEEIDAKNEIYGGIKNMAQRPGAVFVFDMNEEANAVREARKLGVPVIALTDTNTDPSLANIAIPCNDDAIKTVELVADYLRQAVQAGQAKSAKNEEPAEKTA